MLGNPAQGLLCQEHIYPARVDPASKGPAIHKWRHTNFLESSKIEHWATAQRMYTPLICQLFSILFTNRNGEKLKDKFYASKIVKIFKYFYEIRGSKESMEIHE